MSTILRFLLTEDTALSNFELSIAFFLQAAVLLTVCRVVGWLARRFLAQPQVVGEMIAGVLLGPSFFSQIAPELQAQLFPRGASMSILYAIAQMGLVIYMFLIGADFHLGLFRQRVRTAAAVSIAGMAAPFALGCLLAAWFVQRGNLFQSDVSTGEAMLFLGAAMSITAFPMLARIIHERGITGTTLGTLALAAGSIDDAAAWCVLAIVLASFKSAPAIAWMAIAGGTAYTVLTLTVGRRMLAPLNGLVERAGELRSNVLAGVLLLLMLAAWLTDFLGVHAVFGAFILGAAMPRGKLTEELQRTLEPLTTSFLVPFFFVYSGLNTRIDLVNTVDLWMISGVVLLAACAGKGLACWAAARLCGEQKEDAVGLGALMNARGMMELIILNIGLERGLITPQLFSVMVIMAIVTTLLASPLLTLAMRSRRDSVIGQPVAIT